MKSYTFLPLLSFTLFANAEVFSDWRAGVSEIRVRSSADGAEQPVLVWSPAGDAEPRPLLVGLHTWSSDYRSASNGVVFARWAMQRGWHFIHPNFRGPNRSPQAAGSDLAVQDIVDAVEHMKATARVDASRIYLIGASGGGHMAMLMAGRHPEIWAGVSAWVGIGDLGRWHAEHVKEGKPSRYARDLEMCLGGPPDTDERRADARRRSPLAWLARAKGVPLDLNHGVHDGRTGSVPFHHSLLAFNAIAAAGDRLPEDEIARYYETQSLPASWPAPEPDALYSGKPVLFRKVSGQARVTIFDGGHEILYLPALNWLAQQRRGQPVVWTIADPVKIQAADTQSGK